MSREKLELIKVPKKVVSFTPVRIEGIKGGSPVYDEEGNRVGFTQQMEVKIQTTIIQYSDGTRRLI